MSSVILYPALRAESLALSSLGYLALFCQIMSRSGQAPFTDPAAFADDPRPVVAFANDYPSGYEIAPHRHAHARAFLLRGLALCA